MQNIPPAPRHMMEWLEAETGTPATIRRQGRQLVVEHKNDRVRMTATYGFKRGTCAQTSSTLEVDGEQTVLAATPDEYVQVFRGEAVPTGQDSATDAKVAQMNAPIRRSDQRIVNAVHAGPRHNR